MFEESTDELAAEKEFYEILKGGHTSKENIRKLQIHFLKSFRISYRGLKSILSRKSSDDEFNNRVWGAFKSVTNDLRIVLESKKWEQLSAEDEAKKLGTILGTFLAGVEYGIASEKFNVAVSTKILNEIKDNIRYTVGYLERLNNSVKYKFIRNQVERIGRKHAHKLSEKHLKFISEIAAGFG